MCMGVYIFTVQTLAELCLQYMRFKLNMMVVHGVWVCTSALVSVVSELWNCMGFLGCSCLVIRTS